MAIPAVIRATKATNIVRLLPRTKLNTTGTRASKPGIKKISNIIVELIIN